MKPFTYYTTRKTSYPNKRDYLTLYVYDKGACIDSCVYCYSVELKKKYPGAVIQEVLNEEEYRKHLDQYNAENGKLHLEFQNDLFEEFGVVDNPKRFKCFELAWDKGHSAGCSEVYSVFQDLVELIW